MHATESSGDKRFPSLQQHTKGCTERPKEAFPIAQFHCLLEPSALRAKAYLDENTGRLCLGRIHCCGATPATRLASAALDPVPAGHLDQHHGYCAPTSPSGSGRPDLCGLWPSGDHESDPGLLYQRAMEKLHVRLRCRQQRLGSRLADLYALLPLAHPSARSQRCSLPAPPFCDRADLVIPLQYSACVLALDLYN